MSSKLMQSTIATALTGISLLVAEVVFSPTRAAQQFSCTEHSVEHTNTRVIERWNRNITQTIDLTIASEAASNVVEAV